MSSFSGLLSGFPTILLLLQIATRLAISLQGLSTTISTLVFIIVWGSLILLVLFYHTKTIFRNIRSMRCHQITHMTETFGKWFMYGPTYNLCEMLLRGWTKMNKINFSISLSYSSRWDSDLQTYTAELTTSFENA